MTAEAVRYYFPALVRVALDPNLKGNPSGKLWGRSVPSVLVKIRDGYDT